MNLHTCRKSLFRYLALGCLALAGSCAAPDSGMGPARGLSLDASYKYQVGAISTEPEQAADIDVAVLLGQALHDQLQQKEMLVSAPVPDRYYRIDAKILEYDMGNAFKRWLLPGYGATVLGVHTDIVDVSTGTIAAEMAHKRTVAAGGLYSAGAGKSIITGIAKDITADLERRSTGGKRGFTVGLDPWLLHETEVPRATLSAAVESVQLADQRTEKFRIGERQAAFGVSMGDVFANTDVIAYLREAIENELLASGNRLTRDPKDIRLTGSVNKFWVHTDTTALYWDVIGEVELHLVAVDPVSQKEISRDYRGEATSRTYVWPTEKLLHDVLSEMVRALMLDVRRDSLWAQVR